MVAGAICQTAGAAQGGPAAAAATERATFTILFTGRTIDLDEVEGRGGFARLASLIRRERLRDPGLILLHGGDSLSVGPLSAYDEGAHQIDLLNELDVDAMSVQGRDFNHGEDVLSLRAGEALFPLLASNAVSEADGDALEGLERWTLLEAGPVRLGILSLMGGDDLVRSAAVRTRLEEPVESLRRLRAELRNRGADIIVVMTSDRRGLDLALRDSGLADIVLSMQRPEMQAGAMILPHTVFAAASENARWSVALDIQASVTGTGQDRRVVWHPSVRLIDSGAIPPDPEMAARVAAYQKRLSAQRDTPVLTLSGPMDTLTDKVRSGESAFADLVADTVFAEVSAAVDGLDAVLLNAGMIRGARGYEAGHVLTRGDILQELPFRNRVVVLEVPGASLLAALEHGLFDVENRSGGVRDGRFPVIANMRVSADVSRPPGGRVTEVTVGGRPLDPNRTYRIATTSFLAGGGDGYTVLIGLPRVLDDAQAVVLSTMVMDAWARRKATAPTVDGRIQIRAPARTR